MTLAEFRSIMESRGPVQRDGRNWRGRCPCHNDDGNRGDLAFREEDGKLLVKCWKGCETKSVVEALGLTCSDLFSKNGHLKQPSAPKRERPRTVYPDLAHAVEAISGRLHADYVQGWTYKTADGSDALWVLRFQDADGEKTYRPLHPEANGFAEGDPPGPLPLYNLPAEILRDKTSTVFVCEGEKTANAGTSIGLLATTSAHGARSADKSDWSPLAGRDAVILPDNDPDGERYASDVAKILLGLNPPARVRIVRLPGLPAKGDLFDFVEARDAVEPETLRAQIMALVEKSKPEEKTAVAAATHRQTDEPGKPEKCPRNGGAKRRPEPYNRTDVGNAERLRNLHGAKLRFCERMGGWACYDGRRWDFKTGRTKATQRAVETVRHIAAVEAMDSRLDKADREKLFAWSLRCENSDKITAMLKCAETLDGLVADPGDFDRDPYLFNCANGTIDLRTGVLRPHNSADMITAVTPVEYDPEYTDSEAQHLWDRHLNRVLGGDQELIAFLQRAVGYTLTGDTREEVLFFVNGPTAGGKSTTIEALKATFGEDYTKTARFESFLKKTGDGGPSNDIARLAGARFVASVEVDDGKQLAEGLVKQLTGRDTVSARFLYREAFDFKPAFKLWLCANAAPRVNDSDAAMWRRIVLVPFLHTIPQADRDPAIKDKLTDPRIGGPAILAWAVQGCLDWQQQGLKPPEIVLTKTSEYRANQDPLKDFFADECSFGADYTVPVSQLRQAYIEYAKDNGIRFPLSPREFNDRLRTRGCKDERHRFDGKLQRCWAGVTILWADPAEEGSL